MYETFRTESKIKKKTSERKSCKISHQISQIGKRNLRQPTHRL